MQQTVQALLTATAERASGVVIAVLVVAIAFVLSQSAKRFVVRFAAEGHLRADLAARLQTVRRWTIAVVSVLIVLQSLGVFDHAWALLSAVLAAVAIGFFAFWSILSHATSALFLLVLRPFRIGDRLEIVEPTSPEKAIAGRVVDMNLVFTTLEQVDPETGKPCTMHIPNNLLLQKMLRTGGASPRQTEPFFERAPSEDDGTTGGGATGAGA